MPFPSRFAIVEPHRKLRGLETSELLYHAAPSVTALRSSGGRLRSEICRYLVPQPGDWEDARVGKNEA